MTNETQIVKVTEEMNLETVQEKVNGMQAKIDAITVESDEQLASVADVIKSIKTLGKFVKQEKERFTKPAQDIINNARAKYLPYEKACTQAENTLKNKAAKYMNDKEQERLKKEAQIAARAEKGTIKEETAVRKMGELGEQQKTVQTESTQMQTKKVKTVEFVDLKEVSDKDIIKLARDGYLKWDEVKARKVALAGVELPGVKVTEKTSIAIR